MCHQGNGAVVLKKSIKAYIEDALKDNEEPRARHRELAEAAIRGDEKRVREFICLNANMFSFDLSYHAAELAIAGGHINVLKALVEAGLDINPKCHFLTYKSLMYQSLESGNPATFKYLLANLMEQIRPWQSVI